jgi:hypothetical protein
MLRIRNNATVRKLEIPQSLRDFLARPRMNSDTIKHNAIKKFMDVSACSVCGDIPTCEVIYQLEGCKKVEHYCDKCVKNVYARESVL